MRDYLENIWIINSSGVCYYHKQFDDNLPNMNENNFASFITAILAFTKDIYQDPTKKLTLGGFDIFIESFNEFFVVLSSKKGKNEKEIFKSISEIGKAFKLKFANVLFNKFLSNSDFEEFNETIVNLKI